MLLRMYHSAEADLLSAEADLLSAEADLLSAEAELLHCWLTYRPILVRAMMPWWQ